MVGEQLDPILRQIAAQSNALAQAQSSAIGSVTNQYASELGRWADQSDIFGPGQQIVKSTGEGLNTMLTQTGKAQAKGLAQSQAQAGQTSTSQGSDINLAKEGKGAGGAAGAIGKAMLDSLRAEQAAAEKYGSQLPGFAQLEGQQTTKGVLMQLASEMARQMADVTAQAPGMVHDIYRELVADYKDDRDFQEKVREYNQERQDAINANKAKIVGAGAPTLAGRQQYWEAKAAERTKYDPHGYVWEGTTTGIRPVRDPKTGRPIVDPAFAAAQQAGLIKQQDAAVKTKLSSTITVGSDKTGRYLVDKLTGQRVLITPPVKPGAPKPSKPVTFKGTDGRTWTWDPKTNKAAPIPGQPGPKKTGTAKTQQPTGTAPRRTAPGKWVTRSGKPLSPAASAIWERKWRNGETDGRGKVYPPKKKKAGAASGAFDPSTGQYG